jgi:putative ABC transport system ATP-binding protein
MNETVLRAAAVSRVYGSGDREVTAVDDVSLELRAGELVVLKGRSGSGKTTLLGMLGGLDRPTRGQVWLDDIEMSAAAESELVAARRTRLGFVFQTFGLLPVLSAAENVEIPLRLAGVAPAERGARVHELLDLVGLTKHADQRPSELSGGQQQRVGIARALAMRPGVLLADEPTGQLDSGTAATIMDLLVSLVHDEGVAAIVATHDPLLVARADRVLELHDGRVREQPRHGRHVAT